MVEAAWVAVRSHPYWKAMFERLADRLGRPKAIVAIARKLLVVVWHVLAEQVADREPIRELQAWIADHLDEELAVPALASQVAMSERNFARVFRREVGCPPARFVERARVEGARRRLEESTDGVDVIAAQCGFASAEVMRRAFLRLLGVPPSAYRGRFRSAARA